MGLAASQARLLTLTTRKNDIEGQLMNIANQKMALSRDSAAIATQYEEALNATKLVWNKDDGSSANLSYNLLMGVGAASNKQQYILTDSAGAVLLKQAYYNALVSAGCISAGKSGQLAGSKSEYDFAAAMLSEELGKNVTSAECSNTGSKISNGTITTGTTTTTCSSGTTITPAQVAFYLNMYNEIKSYGWKLYTGSDAALKNEILNGNVCVKHIKADSTLEDITTSTAGSPLSEENDSSAETTAEAEYNAEKDQVTTKEKLLDMSMSRLDNERSSILTEIESVQNVIKKNMDNFKVFDA